MSSLDPSAFSFSHLCAAEAEGGLFAETGFIGEVNELRVAADYKRCKYPPDLDARLFSSVESFDLNQARDSFLALFNVSFIKPELEGVVRWYISVIGGKLAYEILSNQSAKSFVFMC